VTTLFLHFDKQNKEIIIYNSNKHFHSSFTLNEQRLNIVEFKHTIMWYRSLEQYISKKNNTILAFEKMWTPLQYIFN
jgi:hypothetical protein